MLIASTSKTDYAESVDLAPGISKQAATRVAASCGRFTVGLQVGHPEANFKLHTTTLKPVHPTAYNPKQIRKNLAEDGQDFAETWLVDPLEARGETKGSPFLATLAKTGAEIEANDWQRATVVVIGDGTVVERPPGGGPMVKFGQETVSEQSIEDFVPSLETLKGSCVILIGAGARSKLPDSVIREDRELLGEILEDAGIEFVATRSANLPPHC